MMSNRSVAAVLLVLALMLFAFPPHAYAYLDPGTGSYLWQIALAALAGSLFAIRLFWTRIKLFFKKLGSRSKEKVGGGS